MFSLLNCDNTLECALDDADARGEHLQLSVRTGDLPRLPFELLYDSEFLVPSKIDLVYRVSDWGKKKRLRSQNRPLRTLFMACSPDGILPVLEFEKEEETIFEVTKMLPIVMDVEDTGSLEGFRECCSRTEYDVIHLSGHAGIDDRGPFFWMEDEVGCPDKVYPSDLWNALSQSFSQPRLIFLSACHTAEMSYYTSASFAHQLVLDHSSLVLGWARPVSDAGAILAAEKLYFELSRGRSVLDAAFSIRRELFRRGLPDWPLLRLFSDGTPLDIPVVKKGQKRRTRKREIQYRYLENSQVRVLKKGFIGRRRQIQRGIRCLRENEEKIGLLLHGTGGLGKSCLAGKLCERLKDHVLIVVHGNLNELTFLEAVKHGFMRAEDKNGLKILREKEDFLDKVMRLCFSSFQDNNYFILLDDFEKNLKRIGQGAVISCEAAPILRALLRNLPYASKMSQIVITCRYVFPLVDNDRDLVQEQLELIGLTSFRGADEKKKIAGLKSIASYPDLKTREMLIETGRGNPRLMEALDMLLEVEKNLDVEPLLLAVKDKEDEFVQGLLLEEIMNKQSEGFQQTVKYSSVYGVPVTKEGIGIVCRSISGWDSFLRLGVELSLMEQDRRGAEDSLYYWVSPLLRGRIFSDISNQERRSCHQLAVEYYKKILSSRDHFDAICASELVHHALESGMQDIAVEEGGKLLSQLRDSFAFEKALSEGTSILSGLSSPKRDGHFAVFLCELGEVYGDTGNPKKAIEHFEQALAIALGLYGEKHSETALAYSGLGGAWMDLGNLKKALEYYEKALSIDKEIYGERHLEVGKDLQDLASVWRNLGRSQKALLYLVEALSIAEEEGEAGKEQIPSLYNSLGLIWRILGDSRKALEYYEKALEIDREMYGERHPKVATLINNIGAALKSLGNQQKALEYYEKALSIDEAIYGKKHPRVASRLNNIGGALRDLGNPKRALEYYERALSIDEEVYGKKHPRVASRLNNIGGALRDLGNPKRALEYYERALSIVQETYHERHPSIALALNSLGLAWRSLGNPQKALHYFEESLSITKEVYGEDHPRIATAFNNIGSVWKDVGKLEEAIACGEKALAIDRVTYGENHPKVALRLSNMGSVWRDLGDLQKAREYIEEALSIDKRIYGETHPKVARDLRNFGMVYGDLGNPGAAHECFQEAYRIFKGVLGEEHPRTAVVRELLVALQGADHFLSSHPEDEQSGKKES
ncbi:MAG: tetratricopeptide repeat protein [Theionarchaea archaeon]|nr:tetratricopeptide repeat protein [Theionarchaea archaeon]